MICEKFFGRLLQEVIFTGKIKSKETVSKNEFKTSWNNELKIDSWKEKRLQGQFLRGIPGTTHVRETWSRLRKSEWKIQTEALICAGQEQALRTNHVTDTILTRRRECPLCG